MKSKVFGCLGVVLVVGLFASLMLNIFLGAMVMPGAELSTLTSHAVEPTPFRVELVRKPESRGTRDRVVQIDLAGIISGESLGDDSMVSLVRQALKQAVADERAKAIVLRIDSPGGEVAASDTIYHLVGAASAEKPVVVYMDSMAASGGYYIACAAERIVAHPLSITGSIGVIMQGLGYRGLLDKVGLEMRTFKSGPMKDAGSGARELTVEEQQFFQEMIDKNYQRFIEIVSRERGIPLEELRGRLADGRIFLGTEAENHGLVDRTGYLEEAYVEAMELAGVSDAEVVRYTSPPGLLDVLGMFGQARAATPRLEIDFSERLLPRLRPGVCYYLPTGWVP